MKAPRISVQTRAFAPDLPPDFGQDAGAVVTFTGIVRADDGLLALEIEHYPGMTETMLTRFAKAAMARFDLLDAEVIHRFGHLPVGAPIMRVATAARHRRAAFEGAEYLMDWLKTRAPFWKCEIDANGPRGWVAARTEDEDARNRWSDTRDSTEKLQSGASGSI